MRGVELTKEPNLSTKTMKIQWQRLHRFIGLRIIRHGGDSKNNGGSNDDTNGLGGRI